MSSLLRATVQALPTSMVERTLDAVAALSAKCGRLRARGALAQVLYSASGGKTSGEWHIKMRRGFTMTLPRSSAMTWIAAFTGDYDEDEIALLSRFVLPDTFILDVGASFGFYALSFGVAGRSMGVDVVAVEPLPKNLAKLRENVAANHLGDTVMIVPMALGRERGTIYLTPTEPGGIGNAVASREANGSDPSARVEVPLESLDALELGRWTSKKRCSLMKMDIEGSELNVLEGGSRFLGEHRPTIFGEFNSYFMEQARMEPMGPQLWAERSDYRCFEIHLRRASSVSDRKAVSLRSLGRYSARWGGNLLFVPSERAESVSDLLESK
jgi:FkbM family methyltransferase